MSQGGCKGRFGGKQTFEYLEQIFEMIISYWDIKIDIPTDVPTNFSRLSHQENLFFQKGTIAGNGLAVNSQF